jgi:hypothetical protein
VNRKEESPGSVRGAQQRLQATDALIAVAAGLLALLVIATVAIGVVHDDSHAVASIATAAFAVIGSVVGAYFGIKVGAEGTQRALDAHKAEAARAQVFAAHLPESRAREALIQADRLARGVPLDKQDPSADESNA